MTKSVGTLMYSSVCFLTKICYKERTRANKVRVRALRVFLGLTMPCQISLGMPHTINHGTRTRTMFWLSEWNSDPGDTLVSNPVTGAISCSWTDPGPEFALVHAQCTVLPIT